MTPPRQRTEYRMIVEESLGERESRVNRTETRIDSEEAARILDSWWKARSARFAMIAKGWVEARMVTDWEELSVHDAHRRGAE